MSKETVRISSCGAGHYCKGTLTLRSRLQLPVYLDDPVQDRLAALAEAKGVELSALVNDLLRKDIELIEVAR